MAGKQAAQAGAQAAALRHCTEARGYYGAHGACVPIEVQLALVCSLCMCSLARQAVNSVMLQGVPQALLPAAAVWHLPVYLNLCYHSATECQTTSLLCIQTIHVSVSASDTNFLLHPTASALQHPTKLGSLSERRDVRYNFACACALAGCHDEARSMLEQLAAAGALKAGDVASDEDLAQYRGHDWFQAILAQLPAS